VKRGAGPFGRGGRGRHLRRVSPAKARSGTAAQPRETLPHQGEKLTVVVVGALLAVVVIGQGAASDLRTWAALIGLAALIVAGLARYVADFRRAALVSVSRVVGLVAALLVPLVAVAACERAWGVADLAWLPLPLVALIVALVAGRALAVEATLGAAALLLAYLALRERADGAALAGLAVTTGGALAGVLAAARVRRRATLVRVGLLVGCTQAALAACFLLLQQDAPGMLDLWRLARLALAGIVTGLLVSGLLPAVEAAFDVTTDISLLELGNTHESPLLRKLLLEASGTFHHSYIVGLLGEAAAEAIGANALLTRVGALYHDVGKLNKPEYFAENSADARDRHKALTPEMSMMIISAHTRDGVELGLYYGLPQALLDFMVEHHGTTCLEYFHHRAVDLRGEENVTEARFRYGGPRPQSRESAIVMVADAAEAISRQMPDPTQPRLEEMVHRVAMKRLMDGQFDECGLTLAELARIEEACVRVLGAIYHTRPTYPRGRPHPLDLSQGGAVDPERSATPIG
jgi:putative nucleotidyltransferase with HDIG domain